MLPISAFSSPDVVESSHLVVAHYHWRTGGVRRVIERGLSAVLASPCWPALEEIRLLGDSLPPREWWVPCQERLTRLRPGVRLTAVACPELGYAAELGRRPDGARLREFLRQHLPAQAVVWLHNPALARNPVSTREIVAACQRQDAVLLFHHHDFWCDNRWERWKEARAQGFRTTAELAVALFPVQPGVVHVTINRADHQALAGVWPAGVRWLPNCFDPFLPPSSKQKKSAQKWLRLQASRVSTGRTRPHVWLLPCRWLRRKNPLEALLLSQVLDQKAVLVTAGSPSSAAEQASFHRVLAACQQHRWPLSLASFEASGTPPFDHLQAAAEVLVLTSLQEGFGLAFLEASAVQRPLVCRRLPAILPDLEKLGFAFPHSYEEWWVESGLAGGRAEVLRQERLWRAWRASLPGVWRAWAEPPPVLQQPTAAQWPFSRLTLTGQMEVLQAVLARPPSLPTAWQIPLWPEGAQELRGEAYARALAQAARAAIALDGPKQPELSVAMQEALMRDRLSSYNLYPLLFSPQS